MLPEIAFFKRRIRLKRNSSISIPLGFVLLFPCLVIILILLLFLRHSSPSGGPLFPAGTPPSIRFVLTLVLLLFPLLISSRKISEEHDKVFATGCLHVDNTTPRANAAFVVLARNKEVEGVVQSIKSIERHFNRWYNYPYVFLNDADFDQKFKDTVRNYTSGHTEFGKIDSSMWGFPDWADHEVAKEGIRKQGDSLIMYGGMESYHHMCRFYSG